MNKNFDDGKQIDLFPTSEIQRRDIDRESERVESEKAQKEKHKRKKQPKYRNIWAVRLFIY